MVEREEEIEEAMLTRKRARHRAAKDKYERCRALGILGKVWHAVAMDYKITPVWLSHYNKRGSTRRA